MIKEKGFLPFEKLDIWINARELVKFSYSVTKTMSDRSFKEQLQRASISIMNNIAEGRESGSAKAFLRYLKIAKGSCGEVRSMFYAGRDLQFMSYGPTLQPFKLSILFSSYVHQGVPRAWEG